jgi:hypothetical protein
VIRDWDEDGVDTVGIYNPVTGVFFCGMIITQGQLTKYFSLGPGAGMDNVKW